MALDSLTLEDLAGVNTSGHISFSVGANSCATLSLGIPGAKVGQGALLSVTNSVATSSVVFGPMRVSAADTGSVTACNVGGSAVSVSALGVRIITFE